jgi:hypothetical protein
MQIFGRLFKKTLTYLVAGSTSIFIAACYGVGMLDIPIRWIIKTQNLENKPIPGLKVTVYQNDHGTISTVQSYFDKTDSIGIYDINLYIPNKSDGPRFSAKISDIDGEMNGGLYRDTTIELSSPDTSKVIMNQ